MDFNTLDDQIQTNMDIFQPSKVDIFIIKAYKIVTNGTILNSYHITTSSSSPLNNANEPDETDNEGLNNGKTPRRKKKGSVIHPQYSKTFFKLSKIYSSLLPSGIFGEISTSPKSDIELFQRFQQILKELELNFEMSAYSKYFNRVSETLFQIKEDNELTVDGPFWISLTESILNYYNPRTGKLINQGRKKNIVKRNVSAGKNEEKRNNESTNNNNNNNNNTTNSNNDFFNMTNNMLNDPALSLQLQRKLQMIPQEVTSRSLNGYYTQPTSPGSGGFPFNLGTTDDDDILGNNFNNTDVTGIAFNSNDSNNASNNNNGNNGNVPLQNGSNGNYNYLNHKKRRSLGSLSLDESAVDDLLKFTTINKKQRTPQSFSNMIDDFRFQSNGAVNDKGPLTKMNNVQMLDKDGNITSNDDINMGNMNTNDPGTSTSLPGNDMNGVTNQQSNSNANSVPNTNMGNTLDVNSNLDTSNAGSVINQVPNNGSNGDNIGMLAALNNGLMNPTNNNDQNNKDANMGTMNDTNRMQLNNLNMADPTRMNNMQITPESTMNSNPANINVSGNTGDSSTSAMASSAFSGQDNGRIMQNGNNNNNPANSQRFDALVNELNRKYDAIIIEKDKRITSLEAELESQRQETMWLRKMLIEDMGYIRNFLQNSQR